MAGAAPHTPFPAFSFLTCAVPPFPAAPHTPFPAFAFLTCAFLFSTTAPHTPFLSSSFLACAVPPFPAAPHTSFLAFSFLTCMCPFSTTAPAHVISRFSAFCSCLSIFIHIFSFSLLTIVNIRDNMCTNKNERRCFYVY